MDNHVLVITIPQSLKRLQLIFIPALKGQGFQYISYKLLRNTVLLITKKKATDFGGSQSFCISDFIEQLLAHLR